MRNSSLRPTITLSSLLLLSGFYVPTLFAQRDAMRPPAVLVRAKEINEAERDRNLKAVPKVPPVSDKELQKIRAALMKQLGNDFRTLQIVDNEMMSEAVASKELNCEHLARQLTQIRARASNLKASLALPEVPVPSTAGKKAQPDQISDHLVRTQLESLDSSIQVFVKNPIFRDPNVLDVKLSVEASQNLKSILDLSDEIKRNASKLAKQQKPQP